MSVEKKPVRVGVCDKMLAEEIRGYSLGFPHEVVLYSGDPHACDLVIAGEKEIQDITAKIENGHRPTLFVTGEEGAPLPQVFQEGRCDDIVLLPLRRLDLVRAVKLHYTFATIRELEHTSAALPEVIRKLEEDVQLAQKIQRKLIRDRFPKMGPISIKSKYWCGLKSGGDYFDIIEFPDGIHAGIFMADCSSYSLSTALLGSLVQLSLQGSEGGVATPEQRLKILEQKVGAEMKEKDRLSIFFGILNRKTLKMEYVSSGSTGLVIERSGKTEVVLSGDAAPLTKTGWRAPKSRALQLENGDRMAVFSDGWGACSGEPAPKIVSELLGECGNDAQAFVNELSFRVQKKLDDDSMPAEDCSVLLFHVAKNALRLAQ